MGGILGLIRSRYGIVVLSDSALDPNQNTETVQINKKCIASVFRGKEGVKKFLEDHIIPKNIQDLDELIQVTLSEFTQHHQDYTEYNFSFFIAGYENGQSKIQTMWFQDGKPRTENITTFTYFIDGINDLALYLITKVYSEHMSIDELKDLIIFVALQCVKVFGIPSIFDLTLISEEGVKKIKSTDFDSALYNQDKLDHELKKLLSDFFVREKKA